MASQLDYLTTEDVVDMTQPAKKAYCIRIAATAWGELGRESRVADVARYIKPHCERLGLPAAKRSLERYCEDARDQAIASIHPADIERTREVLGVDARSAAMRFFALTEAVLPEPETVTAAIKDDDDKKLKHLMSRMRSGSKMLESALAADAQVIKLFHLVQIQPMSELLTKPEQRSASVDMFVRIAPMLSVADRELLRDALSRGDREETTARPALAIVRGDK